MLLFFFFSSRRRHTRFDCDWSSDVCSSDLPVDGLEELEELVPGDLLEVLPGIASRHVEAQDSRAFLVVDVPDYRWDSIALLGPPPDLVVIGVRFPLMWSPPVSTPTYSSGGPRNSCTVVYPHLRRGTHRPRESPWR